MKKSVIYLVTTCFLLVTGCENNQQTGQLLGAGGGALFGGVVGKMLGGKNGQMATLAGSAIGAAGGAFIGGAIGRSLDQRDQHKASAATQQVLSQPAPAYMLPPDQAEPTPTPSQRRVAPSRTQTSSVRASAAPSAKWTSDHSGAKGSSSVVAVEPTSDGGECRSVHEIAYVGGQEISQDQRYCRGGGGDWQKV